jgi:hypothetical protein
MNSAMRYDKFNAGRVDPLEFEEECETWDWARAAGISAHDLRRAVREALASRPAFAEAA